MNDIRVLNSKRRAQARLVLIEEESTQIQRLDSSSRAAARSILSDEELANIRDLDSASRAAARSQLTDEESSILREINTSYHNNVAQNNTNIANDLLSILWGNDVDIRQRVEPAKKITDYRDFEQNSSIAKFLSHEFPGVVQLEKSGDFLQTEDSFQSRLNHMERIKVILHTCNSVIMCL